jgi:hypothetical protein
VSIHSYDVGDIVRLGNHSTNTDTAAFTDASGVATDPTTVTLVLDKPDGTTTTYTYLGNPALLKETTGRYYVDVALTLAGLWYYRLAGTGTVQAAAEGVLNVRSSLVL